MNAPQHPQPARVLGHRYTLQEAAALMGTGRNTLMQALTRARHARRPQRRHSPAHKHRPLSR